MKECNGYVVMTMEELKEFDRKARIDQDHMCEWQCPMCKNRVRNLQMERNAKGEPMWGCYKFCDTIDASYFDGHACLLFNEGDSFIVWP